jgi:subtilisin family serine protease
LIAILDTGVDQVHYETGEFANSHDRILLGHNWCNPGAPPWDDHYLRHGTERLGEIAAPRGDEFGIAGIISGVEGPNGQLCKVLVEKVADGSSFFTDELAGGLIRVAIEEGARVISVSLWCYPPAQAVDPTKAAIEYLEECARYTIILACCLDTEQSLGYIPYPAAWSCDYDNVMAIGASTDEDTFWEYSEWRSGPLGGQVSLIAPGECTYWAAHADGSYMYGQAGGTSGATAHAAGIAGMMISKFPGLKYEIIKDRLQDSAKRIAEPEGCAWGDYEDCWGHRCWCDRPGSGRIDALYCLKPRLHVNCPRSGTAPGGHVSAAGSISGSHPDPGELVVYDLLGRRLCSVGVAGFPTNQAMLQSFVDREACIPSGPTIVRIVTDTEVRTWKIVK